MSRTFRSAALVALAVGTLLGVDWKALRPEGYVSDFARVIDPQSKAALEQYCAAVAKSTGAEIALVTLPSLQGEPIEDVANTIFHAWGVGSKGQNDGIMLLLSTGERKSRLEVGYGLEPIIPDGFAGTILDEMRPALREQRYGEALLAAADKIGTTIAQAKNVQIGVSPPRPAHRHPKSIPWPIIIGGIVLVAILMRKGGRGSGYSGTGGGGFLPGLILGNMMGRSTWGSRGSGGFGGYDSGDSFGGFGGGDSGGGGASSDW
jgi:uncharacterized protein